MSKMRINKTQGNSKREEEGREEEEDKGRRRGRRLYSTAHGPDDAKLEYAARIDSPPFS